MAQLQGVINLLGLPGLIVLFWYVDGRRISGIQSQTMEILSQYKHDVEKVTRYYERNVELVERYEKLSDELSRIIQLNTQIQTRLVDTIENNMFCPAVRKAGPRGG